MAYTGTSIVDYLKSEGRQSSFSARKKLAGELGIAGYRGTARQNTAMLKLLREQAKGASHASAGGSSGGTAGGAQTSAAGQADGRPRYAASEELSRLQQELAAREGAGKGDYTSPYQEQIDQLLKDTLARDKFSYDPYADPVYQQYRAAYLKNGRKAMRDSAANAAALTGGYGNSYAETAGAQAYESYLSELNNIVPTLYENAFARYRAEGEDALSRLGLLGDLDADAYQKYRDEVADAYADLNYYYKKYGDLSEREYQKYLSDLESWQADRDFYYQQQQDERAQSNWEREFALSQAAAAAKRSGRSSSRRRGKSSKSSAKASTSTALSKEAEEVLRQVLGLRDAGRQNDYVKNALQKGRISADEASRIIRQL